MHHPVIHFLGTAAGMPSKKRNVSAIAIRFEMASQTWLIDCGEGTQQQILHSSIRPPQIERIFVTHMHGDHWFGLPGLLSTMNSLDRTEGVILVGPRGLQEALEAVFKASQTKFQFEIDYKETIPGEVYSESGDKGFALHMVPLTHRLPCHGLVVQAPRRPGKFLIDKAKADGVDDQESVRELANGRDIKRSGKVYKASDYRASEINGEKIVILGDTCDSHRIIEFGKGCDVLVQEATYASADKEKAVKYGHSTAAMAGAFAKELGAKNLVLTHFSHRYEKENAPIHLRDLHREAKDAFGSDNVYMAEDFYEFRDY